LPFYSISNGQLLSLWQLKNTGTPQTSKFPDYWANSLGLISSQTGNHPRLVWGPYPTIAAEEFQIYRAISSDDTVPPLSSFSLITTMPGNTFQYTDTEFNLGGPVRVYYFIKAGYYPYKDDPELIFTEPSNIAKVRGVFNKNYESGYDELVQTFSVTNFPNPFNPTTTINHFLPENGFTELKVYNIYGELVETLISENKSAGSHSVQFPLSGKKLASGVYPYTLSSGKYKTSGKMIMMK